MTPHESCFINGSWWTRTDVILNHPTNLSHFPFEFFCANHAKSITKSNTVTIATRNVMPYGHTCFSASARYRHRYAVPYHELRTGLGLHIIDLLPHTM